MSYPRDLEEYTDDELETELLRRNDDRKRGNCSYCGKSMDTYHKKSYDPCRYHETFIGVIDGHIKVERKGG